MEQSQKDVNIKVAWITGGLALVGTVITLIFNNPGPRKEDPPPPPTVTTISPTTAQPTAPFTPIPTTTIPVPPEVVGIWSGGAMGQTNMHLSITASADYIFWDDNVPGSPNRGKVAAKGAILEFYGNDGYFNRFPWSIEKTPQGDLLHMGERHYLRE